MAHLAQLSLESPGPNTPITLEPRPLAGGCLPVLEPRPCCESAWLSLSHLASKGHTWETGELQKHLDGVDVLRLRGWMER